MSSKNASFKTLVEDIKVGFKFTFKNIISFILGVIGVLILTAILMMVVLLIMLTPVIIQTGIGGVATWFMEIFSQISRSSGIVVVGSLVFVVIPLLFPIFIATGALFGMGREVIESNGTSAEGVFVWYKSKFFSLATGGIIAYLIVVIPPAFLTIAIGSVSGGIITDGQYVATAIFSTVWIMMSTGLLSMLFPAIIDGNSAIDALRTSVRLSTRYFDRVFSTWFAFLVIGMLLMAPISLIGSMYNLVMGAFMGGYTVFVGFILVFVIFPATTITLNRVYLILCDEGYITSHDNEPQIGLVGGA